MNYILAVFTHNKLLVSLNGGQPKALDRVNEEVIPGDWLIWLVDGMEKEQLESSFIFTQGIPTRESRGRLFFKIVSELNSTKKEGSQQFIRVAAWIKKTIGQPLYRQFCSVVSACHFTVQAVRFSNRSNTSQDPQQQMLSSEQTVTVISELIRLARSCTDDRFFVHYFLESRGGLGIDLNSILQLAIAHIISQSFRKEQIIKLFKEGLNRELSLITTNQRVTVAKRLVGKLSAFVGEISRQSIRIPPSRLILSAHLLVQFYRDGLSILKEEFLDVVPRILQPFLISLSIILKHHR